MSSVFLFIWQLSLVLSLIFFYIACALNISLGKLQNNLLIVPSMCVKEIQWCGSYVLPLFTMDMTCAIIPLLYWQKLQHLKLLCWLSDKKDWSVSKQLAFEQDLD